MAPQRSPRPVSINSVEIQIAGLMIAALDATGRAAARWT